MSTRIPYGYKIVNGQAEPDPEQVKKLRCFLDYYLEGYSLRAATAMSGIERSWMCCRDMLSNKVYLGTEDYPPLLSPEQLERASREVKKRGAHLVGKYGRPVRQPIPVQTEFVLNKTADDSGKDPVDIAAQLYQSICPCDERKKTGEKGRRSRR